MLLLYPGVLYSPGWGDPRDANTHMVYVYSFLKEYFDVTVIDLEREFGRPRDDRERSRFLERSLERIFSCHAGVVAISCWSSLNYLASKNLAEKIKDRNPDVKIIVGGYHPTLVAEDFEYENAPFDHVVRGDVNNILEVLGRRKRKTNDLQMTRPDFLSYPYSLYRGDVGIFLSTGCAFRCTYCMEYRRRWTACDVPEAIELISDLEAGLSSRTIMILDACFGLDKKWRKAFLKACTQREHTCGFWVQTRVDLIDEEDVELLSKLRIRIDFGVDSLSRTMLRIMNKTQDPETYLEKFVALSRCCSKLGIEHEAYLIFNHPGESDETVEEHDAFFRSRVMSELGNGYLWVSGGTFSLFPGSYVYDHLDRFKEDYGTHVEHPEWWKEPGDQHALSRRLTPSRDRNGRPFSVSPERVRGLIQTFNTGSKRGRRNP
jgi:radical SAM superfamily enzyme YgiQ (UPF0313 family)